MNPGQALRESEGIEQICVTTEGGLFPQIYEPAEASARCQELSKLHGGAVFRRFWGIPMIPQRSYNRVEPAQGIRAQRRRDLIARRDGVVAAEVEEWSLLAVPLARLVARLLPSGDSSAPATLSHQPQMHNGQVFYAPEVFYVKGKFK